MRCNKCRNVLKTGLYKPYLSHASFPNVVVVDCRAISGITIFFKEKHVKISKNVKRGLQTEAYFSVYKDSEGVLQSRNAMIIIHPRT